MEQPMVCIFDRAMNGFLRPFLVPSTGVAVRQFSDEVNRAAEDNNMYQHPEDFDLFHVGNFEDKDGTFSGPVTLLVRGKDVSRSFVPKAN